MSYILGWKGGSTFWLGFHSLHVLYVDSPGSVLSTAYVSPNTAKNEPWTQSQERALKTEPGVSPDTELGVSPEHSQEWAMNVESVLSS